MDDQRTERESGGRVTQSVVIWSVLALSSTYGIYDGISTDQPFEYWFCALAMVGSLWALSHAIAEARQ